MACIILEAVDTINLKTPDGILAKTIFNKFTNFVLKAGALLYRERIVETFDAQGNVTGLTKEVLPFNGFVFDSFASDVLAFDGSSDRIETRTSKKETSRAYIHDGVDVIPGDYLLWDFDVDTELYDGRYEILEKEGHNVQGCKIFHTLYLEKKVK